VSMMMGQSTCVLSVTATSNVGSGSFGYGLIDLGSGALANLADFSKFVARLKLTQIVLKQILIGQLARLAPLAGSIRH